MTGLSLHNSDLVAFQSFFGQKDGFGERTFAKLLNDTNEGVVFAILARFKNTLLELQDTVREGLMGDDHQSIWKMCHKVSGSAALLGFEEFLCKIIVPRQPEASLWLDPFPRTCS